MVKCSCIPQKSAYNFTDMKINETRINEQIDNIKYFLNLNIIFCYNELFCKEGLLKNIINFLIFPFIIFHIICLKKFYSEQKEKLDSRIKDIFWSITNWNLTVKYEKERQNKSEKINILNNDDKIKIENLIQNKKTTKKTKNKNKGAIKPIEIKRQNNNNPPKKDINIHNTKKETNNNQIINFFNIRKETTANDNNVKENIYKNRQIVNESKEIMEITIEEMNKLPYRIALKIDRRTFC